MNALENFSCDTSIGLEPELLNTALQHHSHHSCPPILCSRKQGGHVCDIPPCIPKGGLDWGELTRKHNNGSSCPWSHGYATIQTSSNIQGGNQRFLLKMLAVTLVDEYIRPLTQHKHTENYICLSDFTLLAVYLFQIHMWASMPTRHPLRRRASMQVSVYLFCGADVYSTTKSLVQNFSVA